MPLISKPELEDPLLFTQRLLALDTTNPPGREGPAVDALADSLQEAGFQVTRQPWGEARGNLLAELPGSTSQPPLILSGHIDTVPLANAPWSKDPFAGEVEHGAVYGRGSSDMKAGIAVMICAAWGLAARKSLKRTIRVVLTSGEETGCLGALELQKSLPLGNVSGILIAEPTSNYPALGHKGALFLRCRTAGVTAHSSMPEEGSNAIYKAARAITGIENFRFDSQPHPLLGSPTLNVGMIAGGLNVNSVPDKAEFTVDVRSVRGMDHAEVLQSLQKQMGSDVTLEPFVSLGAVATDHKNPFVQLVFSVMQEVLASPIEPRALPFFTDGSVFSQNSAAPIVVLGPGDPKMAHKTDEYCRVDKIYEAQQCYLRILQEWCA
jgi:succinyl-diaminopimelate desuccinylase